MIRTRVDVRFNKLGQIALAMPQRVGGKTKMSAEAIRDDIRANWSGSSPSSPGAAPAVVSGALDASLTVEKISVSIWSVSVGAEHGVFLEHGTSKMAPRPFLKPAAERQRDRHTKRVAEGVKEAAGAS